MEKWDFDQTLLAMIDQRTDVRASITQWTHGSSVVWTSCSRVSLQLVYSQQLLDGDKVSGKRDHNMYLNVWGELTKTVWSKPKPLHNRLVHLILRRTSLNVDFHETLTICWNIYSCSFYVYVFWTNKRMSEKYIFR